VKKRVSKDLNLKRVNKQTLSFNNLEMQAISKYCKKYRVSNKARFFREAIISQVLKKFDDDYPTLWDQPGLFADNRVKPLTSYEVRASRK